MPTDLPQPQPPVEPPPDLLARARDARFMVLALGIFFALMACIAVIDAVRRATLSSPEPHANLHALWRIVLTALSVLLAIGFATFRPLARRWGSTVCMVFGVARLIGGLLLVFVAVLLHHLGRQEPLLSYWPHTFRLVGLLHGLIRGAVYLWVACFLRTSMVIYLFDRAPRPLNDATLGRALLAEPGSVLAGLRNSSILAVARRDVPRALLLGLGTAVAVLFACVLGLLAIHAVRSTPHPFAPSQPGLRSTLLTDVTSPGDSLVHAVKDYRAHHGRYPQALSDIPSDVRDVLSTPRQARGSWDYSPVLQGRGFQLSIELPADPMMGTVGYRTVLCYRSDGHYADAAFGGKLVERFGEWAFYGD